LLIPLHFALYTYHSPGTLKLTDTHASLDVAREQLVFYARDGVLEGLTLPLESTVTSDLSCQRTIAILTERLIHVVMPHVVSMKKPKDVGRNRRRGNVHIMDGGSVDFTVIRSVTDA
jgi:hypothetical protein